MILLKVSQIAAKLQVTGACIYGWVKEGKLPSVRLGKLVRIEREELNRFLAQRNQNEITPKVKSRA